MILAEWPFVHIRADIHFHADVVAFLELKKECYTNSSESDCNDHHRIAAESTIHAASRLPCAEAATTGIFNGCVNKLNHPKMYIFYVKNDAAC